jgi:hypothetical protein
MATAMVETQPAKNEPMAAVARAGQIQDCCKNP